MTVRHFSTSPDIKDMASYQECSTYRRDEMAGAYIELVQDHFSNE
jgi:hypothetical protein